MRTLQVDIKQLNGSPDFMVKVWLDGGAPQIFDNLPWRECAKRCGAEPLEIEAAEVTKELV